MPRPEKVQAVADIKERLDGAQAVFLAEYAGLSVQEQQALRRELRANGAEFKVVKMTLARLAAADMEIDEFDELLLGPTGMTFADGDPVAAAKALRDFSKSHDVLVVKGGLLGREFLTPERIAELADIEPREVLLARIAGAFEAPMAKMAGLLAALPRNAATAMQQLLEKKEAEQPADVAAEEVAGADEVAEEVTVVEAEEAVVEDAAEEVAGADEVAEAVVEADAEIEADADEPVAQTTESNDEAPVAEASEEDAGTESEDTDEAADETAEEE
jgi:large subunit ribosomal protein L10